MALFPLSIDAHFKILLGLASDKEINISKVCHQFDPLLKVKFDSVDSISLFALLLSLVDI